MAPDRHDVRRVETNALMGSKMWNDRQRGRQGAANGGRGVGRKPEWEEQLVLRKRVCYRFMMG